MGSLLSSLSPSSSYSGDVLELRNAEAPSDNSARAAYERAEVALQEYEHCIQFLKNYQANSKLVQQALANPNDQKIRQEAFEGMFPNVDGIRSFYDLSANLNAAVCDILRIVASPHGGVGNSNYQALVVKLAALFEAVFLFDWAKMSKPAVQNDFSFYRRELSRNTSNPRAPVNDSQASAISMFVAQGSPLLSTLTNDLSNLVKSVRGLVPFLADFANLTAFSASRYTSKGAAPDPDALQTILLSSVIAAVLYDKIDQEGAFVKGSAVSMKRLVQALRAWNGENSSAALSTLQYSSRSFNRAPSNIRKLFP